MTVVAGGLFAQTQPANDGVQQDASDPFHIKTTIVVTGTRTQTELQESPVSTSVLTRTELDMRDTRTLDQGLGLIEGLYSFRSKGSQDTLAGVGMRGFDARGSNQTRVLILLDGQPLNDAYTGWSLLGHLARHGGGARGSRARAVLFSVRRKRHGRRGEHSHPAGGSTPDRSGGAVRNVQLGRVHLAVQRALLEEAGSGRQLPKAAIWRILDQQYLCQRDRGEFGHRAADPRAGVHADHDRRFALRGWPAGRQLVQPARLSNEDSTTPFPQRRRLRCSTSGGAMATVTTARIR